ncbi:cupin domain-containing protein [Pseudomonas grandcourensis]|uniref:cupin domain-containing protein n=1 Tax=Pseudomonas grandcourensis TaxID=3136736 RepID=UPI003263B8F2
MTIRRLVTGTVDGRSVILSDGAVPRHHQYQSIPGFSTALVWATSPSSSHLEAVDDPITPASSYVPAPGESRLLIVTFPPDSVFMSEDFDPAAAYAEQQKQLTGLVEHFDPENPGMHTTPTIDYGIVLEGTVWLELDGGVVEKLEKHNVIIQQGNVHAWRNRSEQPATLAFILIGSRRD